MQHHTGVVGVAGPEPHLEPGAGRTGRAILPHSLLIKSERLWHLFSSLDDKTHPMSLHHVTLEAFGPGKGACSGCLAQLTWAPWIPWPRTEAPHQHIAATKYCGMRAWEILLQEVSHLVCLSTHSFLRSQLKGGNAVVYVA